MYKKKYCILASFALLLSAEFINAQKVCSQEVSNSSSVLQTSVLSKLTLEDCRAMALQHNKEIQISNLGVSKSEFEHKAAKANYLPKVDFIGTYQRTSKSVSLLSTEKQASLSNLGTNAMTNLQQGIANSNLSQTFQQVASQIIATNPDLAPLIQQGAQLANQYASAFSQQVASSLNASGQSIVDALDTDTRNLGVLSVMFTQPLYMGGKIRAYDKITHYSEELAGQKLRAEEQALILDVDKAYWQVVSLTNKRKLATAYRDMLEHLDNDVNKMIAEGVATKANELTVSVKLNEAEMTLMRIDDGLVLSRMLLAQLCGMELDETPVLADEDLANIAVQIENVDGDADVAISNRPELQQLQIANDIYKQKVNIVRSEMLPNLALTGGYLSTYPSLTNGFETRFHGMWNVGVSLKVPLWSWGQSFNKVKAAKTEAAIAALRYDEIKEKVQLQVKQTAFGVNEANRKLMLTTKNLDKAEENLRIAKIGFAEGMIPTSDLLAAQTAWVSAHSDKIDSQIDIMLTRAAYNKALGK